MPYLNLALDPLNGPLVELFVGVSKARADALKAANQAVPKPLRVRGLLDTGASGVAIDPEVIKALALVPTGTILCHTPSTNHQGETKTTYDISLYLVHAPTGQFLQSAVPAAECTLAHQGFEVLIGRSILDRCLFVYDGQAKSYSLAF